MADEIEQLRVCLAARMRELNIARPGSTPI
jgi:hypothetical protein